MENLKTQIDSVRDYAYKRLEDGDFTVIDCYYDESSLDRVRIVVEIDSYKLDLIVSKELNFMFQAGVWSDVILFNSATDIPASINELAEEKLEEYNSKQKDLEIKRLEEKLKELKNQ